MNLIDLFVTDAHAMAPNAQQGGGDGASTMMMLIIMFGILYFFIIRPQSKRVKAHKQLVESLSIGDDVVTAGGIHGKIAALEETIVTIEVATGVKIRVNRSSIMSGKVQQ